ncbi:hypothetical protein [Candidatus Marithrix sp. Canyon 246]|uniref:hypothetical protein n=1 Tax=Candidatus Marithrix sp. Canyon 246 TaxID=1827136 RepID=UPI00114D1D3A|nr:hypothetical protein [Candidatus Marithrix sp. Canyon 246]
MSSFNVATATEDEVQLKKIAPTIQAINIRLKGTKREEEVLDTMKDMVNDILYRARLGVEAIPIATDPTMGSNSNYKNLEIIIHAQSPEKPNQAYQISITLQEQGSRGEPRLFKYVAKDWWYFYRALQVFLLKRLHLQAR